MLLTWDKSSKDTPLIIVWMDNYASDTEVMQGMHIPKLLLACALFRSIIKLTPL